LIVLTCFAAACGRKGPPLPPLVRLPSPPTDFTASRQGDDVTLKFTVPAANTDNSRPANIARVDVFAMTAAGAIAEADVVQRGTKVGTVAVKSPRDAEATIDADDSDELPADVEPPEGPGLDQGTTATLDERLTAAARRATLPPSRGPRFGGASAAIEGPLLGPLPAVAAVRTYVGVGVTPKGKRGPLSRKATVPLVPPPAPPLRVRVTYTETEISVAWDESGAQTVDAGLLPSHPIGVSTAAAGFNVYDAPPDGAPMLLTAMPVKDVPYVDGRIAWGATRCYVVRAVSLVGALEVESDATMPVCAKLVDTFPPAPPGGLNAVATTGEVDLIWDPNAEPDLEGYIVLRGPALGPEGTLVPITPAPIHETNFHDQVSSGVRFVYAVEAVDKAGNVSMPSMRVEETAR
jgi:hypothetical protein